MLILHPRDQPPIGGAYQPADWDAPLADDPFFSLSLSSLLRERRRERNPPRKRNAANRKRSFVRQLRVGRRPFSTASEERPTTKSKPDVQRSIDRVASKRIDPLASLALRSIQFSSVPLFVARTLTARLTVSVAHLRSISRVSSVRGALTTRGVASSSPRPSPRGFFFGRIFVRGVAFIRTFGHLSRRWIGKP